MATQNKYAGGKIYRLVNNVDDKEYVGSTTQALHQRKSGHKNDATTKTKQRVYEHLNKIGWDNVFIVLIENYPCNNRDELKARERYFIEQRKPVLNTFIPLRTPTEYYIDNKDAINEKNTAYYQANKEVVCEKHKEYKRNNKEVIVEKSKAYYQANKDDIAQKVYEYQQANKEKLADKAKQYREAHKEEIAKRKQAYYEANKEAIQARRREIKINKQVNSS